MFVLGQSVETECRIELTKSDHQRNTQRESMDHARWDEDEVAFQPQCECHQNEKAYENGKCWECCSSVDHNIRCDET